MDVERGGTSQASVGAIKTEQDPDEHAQANTHNGAKSPNAQFFFFLVPVRLEAEMSHKSELSFESFIFKGMNIKPTR